MDLPIESGSTTDTDVDKGQPITTLFQNHFLAREKNFIEKAKAVLNSEVKTPLLQEATEGIIEQIDRHTDKEREQTRAHRRPEFAQGLSPDDGLSDRKRPHQ